MTKHKKNSTQQPRHSSRMAAVQALYQIDQTDANPDQVVFDMITDEFKTLTSDNVYVKPDIQFFKDLVTQSQDHKDHIDTTISELLSSGWKLNRLSSVTLAILRLAGHEFLNEILTPHAVIMNEYIEISKDFCESNEVSFVNGILENMSKKLRPAHSA